MAAVLILYLGIMVLMIASMWKVYEKAGKPGWACLVPIYNIIVLSEIAGKDNWWWIFIPILNIVFMFQLYIAVAEKFGQSAGFGIGMIFLGVIFWPILAFGSTQYQGELVSNTEVLDQH